MTRFLSTLPAWGATTRVKITWMPACNFYPRSPRGERPAIFLYSCYHWHISIHAPRVGSDHRPHNRRRRHSNFYPRSPRGERLLLRFRIQILKYFYPRSPRGERPTPAVVGSLTTPNFYPRSPRGERLDMVVCLVRFTTISIHAPRVGSDPIGYTDGCGLSEFLSTLPAWGATSTSSIA